MALKCLAVGFPVLFLLAGAATGQQGQPPPVEWQRTYGGYDRDPLVQMVETSVGGFVIAGSSGSPPGGTKTAPNFSRYDYWLVRIGSDGTPVWDQSFGGLRTDFGMSAMETVDGGFLIGGSTQSTNCGNKTSGLYGVEDYWVIRVDAQGAKLWEQNYGGTAGDILRKIMPGTESGFYLYGDSVSGISGNKTAPNYHTGLYASGDYWLVRVDAAGQMMWDKSYGGNKSEIGWCATTTTDGGLILGGASISGPSGNKTSTNFGGYDFFAVRTDVSGNKLWDASFGGTIDDTMYCIAQMPDGGFMLGGRSDSPPSGNKTSPNYGNFDFWVVRLDATGNKVWEKTFGGTGNEYLYGMDVTKDGGVILAGFSESGPSGNKTSGNYGGADYWLVRLDVDGEKLWEATYGGSQTDEAKDVLQTKDGGFLVGGDSASRISGNKTERSYDFGDFWVLKLAPERPNLAILGPHLANNGLRLALEGIKNLTYSIDWSSNLTDWASLQTNRLIAHRIEIVDALATNYCQRFYRVRQVE